MSSKSCLSLLPLSNFFSRRRSTLSEHLIISDCGNSSIFPMSSEYQFSPWSTEPIKQSTHWQLGWLAPKRVQLYLPWLQLLEGGSDKGVWDVITRRTKLWHRNDRSSYHCSKNCTGWELGPDIEKREHWHRKSTELSSCSIDHSPDCVVWLSWQLNLRRQVWWDCRITWQWTISPSW